MNHEIAYLKQAYKKHTLSNNNNNNNNTSICKAHNVSIRAESEAPDIIESIIVSISEARQVCLTRLFAQHDTTDYW